MFDRYAILTAMKKKVDEAVALEKEDVLRYLEETKAEKVKVEVEGVKVGSVSLVEKSDKVVVLNPMSFMQWCLENDVRPNISVPSALSKTFGSNGRDVISIDGEVIPGCIWEPQNPQLRPSGIDADTIFGLANRFAIEEALYPRLGDGDGR